MKGNFGGRDLKVIRMKIWKRGLVASDTVDKGISLESHLVPSLKLASSFVNSRLTPHALSTSLVDKMMFFGRSERERFSH